MATSNEISVMVQEEVERLRRHLRKHVEEAGDDLGGWARKAGLRKNRLSALLTETGAFPRYTELLAILAALGIPRGRFFAEVYGLEAEDPGR